MNIELRKIEHSPRLSEETYAYAAQVWVDGKHIADVKNAGHGGCDDQYPAKGKTMKDVDALDKCIQKERGMEETSIKMPDGSMFKMQVTLETVCHDLVTEYLHEKELKKLLKRKVLFIKDGKILEYNTNKHWTHEKLIPWVKNKENVAKTLNEMDFQTALAAFKAVMG